MANGVISNTINIDWFGNRDEYAKSDTKIITVGLNPSGREFGNPKSPNVALRFPGITSMLPKHPYKGNFAHQWNNYFNYNPLSWFNQGFEPVLNGIGASYDNSTLLRAIHTDLCTPWATDPTWSSLPKVDKMALTNNYTFQEWKTLIKELKPDIIIACIPNEYRDKIMGHIPTSIIIEISHKKDGGSRKRAIKVYAATYNGALIVFGKSFNIPFGDVSLYQKNKIGEIIKRCYNHLKNNGNIISFTSVVI